MTKLCASMPVAPVLRTSVQYLIAFCSPPEAACDTISGMAADSVGMDTHAKFGDSRLNNGWINRDFGQPRFRHFCAVFSCILQPIRTSCHFQQVCGGWLSTISAWSLLKLFSRNSIRSRRRCHFRPFCRCFLGVYNFRPEVASDVISSAIVDPADMDVRVKFGDF